MECIGVYYNMVVCVLTLRWWVIPPVVSSAVVLNVYEAGAGSVLCKRCVCCYLVSDSCSVSNIGLYMSLYVIHV
jgi:hypothetical protein